MSFNNIYKDKRVLITGHTGFKGGWLTLWLKNLGANVKGISLGITTNPSHFLEANIANDIQDIRVDIRDKTSLQSEILKFKPDFIFHLAAQALVRVSYSDPIATWETNLIGTLNLLESLRCLDNKCSAVIVTSDKCYENNEWVWGYRELDSMGGIDPYSASKGAAELLIHSHMRSFFGPNKSQVKIASARAGNVIGGGDWSESRIIPDCVKAWSGGSAVVLRSPNSTRPWQHVLEPLSGYLTLGMQLAESENISGESYNFGPFAQQDVAVKELVEKMALYWDKVKWSICSEPSSLQHESGLLKLNCDKALRYLNWHAVMDFNETIKMTAEWYCAFYENSRKISDVTNSQIREYTDLAKLRKLQWAT